MIFPTLTAASLFGALGGGGVAIGFAFKDIFQNLLAGILILLTHPFRIGDQMVSGTNEGTVESIEVRATMLRTYDNRRVVIPNSDLYTNRVTVNTAYDRRRWAVEVGIGCDDDIAAAKTIVLDTVVELPGILTDPAPQVLQALKPALLGAGIELPLPTQQVVLQNQPEPSTERGTLSR